MTVIAWDGYTLAADKMLCDQNLICTTTKIFKARGCLVGYSGDAALGMEMVRWFSLGEDEAKFPERQRTSDWCPLLIIRADKAIDMIERGPVPIRYNDAVVAIGSGRDFALTSMHMGKSAEEAVKVACVFDCTCGCGVDTLRLS